MQELPGDAIHKTKLRESPSLEDLAEISIICTVCTILDSKHGWAGH